MRHVTKDYNNARAIKRLRTSTCDKDVQNSSANRKGKYSPSRYGHEEVRQELDKIYHGKCCFCEVKIRPASPEEIEHYRPKSEISGVNDNGYYWLGNEWSNLMMICRTCNGHKSSKFPLNREASRVTSHPTNGKGVDFTMLPIRSKYLGEERPLIINPEYHYPENLLNHDYTCELNAIKNNILGRSTIKVVNLNNQPLVFDKQRIVNELIKRIEDQLWERYNDDPISERHFIRQLNYIFDDLTSRVHPSQEYSLLGINMVLNFEDIILEDLESPFDQIIFEHFINYLESQ